MSGDIIIAAVVLWFCTGWYLNERLKYVHAKLDRLMLNFEGLRQYLYEIDPQFEDERHSDADLASGSSIFAGMNDLELITRKEKQGKRTLNTPLFRQ